MSWHGADDLLCSCAYLPCLEGASGPVRRVRFLSDARLPYAVLVNVRALTASTALTFTFHTAPPRLFPTLLCPPPTIPSSDSNTHYLAFALQLNMTTDTTSLLALEQPCEQTAKQDSAKHWFTRHLLRSVPRQAEGNTQQLKMIRQLSFRRPRTAPPDRPSTAPSLGPAAKDESDPLLRIPAMQLQRSPCRHELKASPRPARPAPEVLLNVDAWLATSKPSSPLMGGLSYWREGDPADSEEAVNVQYAIPIIQEPSYETLSPSHSQQLRSLYRRAKKQVRMPSIRRAKSPRAMEEDANERSESAPVLAVPYEQTQPGEAPFFATRMTATHPLTRPSTAAAASPSTGAGINLRLLPTIDLSLRRDSPGSMQLRELECEMERLALGQSPLTGSNLRPGALAAANLPREDSMGSFSSAPTYFSGMPPPSYKSRPASSRPASILTTSSFGCIDGMNPEQRQLSQRRAAQKQRTMKARLRKLAMKANIRK